MKQLHHSGLPLYLDDDGVMALKPPLNYLGFGRKSAGQMAVVLPEFTEAQRDELAYDVYRGLSFAEDQERLAADSISTTSPSSCREQLARSARKPAVTITAITTRGATPIRKCMK